ncbi:alpha/beta-hydrolase [Sodiomyces alkalinus F11]|uniref:Alpha/beta-hydrolase n=1 Tax=Sodiomyces alkalinus (strain CBS 110278 / VKM F-3762 / F11) TaxID=1314773 RepID=A0A3N2Q4M5_SODAK|nr:alpha/beta-hydrolase [Sodiomyces alkalinus F11]ROT41719.1 alpha/beta-hydrolase [Sodiomyces alkalinus F11]
MWSPGTCVANDACTLAFQTSRPLSGSRSPGPDTPPIVLLMHGFSGSSDYFARNFSPLSERLWVIAPDMRGHGRSSRTPGGYHVARLAADLRDLLAHIRRHTSAPIVPVGCSIGAAVLWTYVELFTASDFAGFIFVDQGPLQDRSVFGGGWDASRAHTGCYDEATLRAAQDFWTSDPPAAHRDLVAGCLGYRQAPPAGENGPPPPSPEQAAEDEAFFTRTSALCDSVWLARLMADHTRYDHREAIDMIDVPTLVMAGRRSGCFPLEGMLETARRLNAIRPGLAKEEVFESGHWLFYEEPDKFNAITAAFVEECSAQAARAT